MTCTTCAYYFTKNGIPSCFHPRTSTAGPILGIPLSDMLQYICINHKFFEEHQLGPKKKYLYGGRIVTKETLDHEDEEHAEWLRKYKEAQKAKEEQELSDFLLNLPVDLDAYFARTYVPCHKEDPWLTAFMFDLPT
jgi:hypothetical protein